MNTKTFLLASSFLGCCILVAQPQAIETSELSAKVEVSEYILDSMELKAMEFYHASTLDIDSFFLDYKELINPHLISTDNDLKIEEMRESLAGKSFIHAQITSTNSTENMFYILLYHPITLEDYGRIRIIFKNDGDLLIDSWDFH